MMNARAQQQLDDEEGSPDGQEQMEEEEMEGEGEDEEEMMLNDEQY
jgi:hypothetical protein